MPAPKKSEIVAFLNRAAMLMRVQLPSERASALADFLLEQQYPASLFNSKTLASLVASFSEHFPSAQHLAEHLTKCLQNREREQAQRSGFATERTPVSVAWAKHVIRPIGPGEFMGDHGRHPFDAAATRVARSILTAEEIAECERIEPPPGIGRDVNTIVDDYLRFNAEIIEAELRKVPEPDRSYMRWLLQDDLRDQAYRIAQARQQGRDATMMPNYTPEAFAHLRNRVRSQPRRPDHTSFKDAIARVVGRAERAYRQGGEPCPDTQTNTAETTQRNTAQTKTEPPARANTSSPSQNSSSAKPTSSTPTATGPGSNSAKPSGPDTPSTKPEMVWSNPNAWRNPNK